MRAPPRYKSTGLPRRFDVAKSIVWAWVRVSATSIEVGKAVSSPASDPAAVTAGSSRRPCSRSCTSLKRATGSLGSTGMSTRAGVKLFAVSSSSARVLIGIAMRNSSIGAPIRSWYRPRAPVTPVTYTSLTLPPSFAAVAFALVSGTENRSKRRASERRASSCERAGSVTINCRRTDPARRTTSSTPRRADSGLARTRAADSRPRRVRPSCWRTVYATAFSTAFAGETRFTGSAKASARRSASASAAMRCVGEGSGGAGGSGSKSSRLSDSFTPPTPSVIVWWTFWRNAARPRSRPSTTVNSHSGRDRSSGVAATAAARSSNCRIPPGAGTAMVRRW